MPKLQTSHNKTLKLTNVLCNEIREDELQDIGAIMERMEGYIRLKGAMPVGPLIQYTNLMVDEHGQASIQLQIFRQCSSFIHQVEAPYQMESVLRIPHCMYVHYVGPEEKMSLAYSKLQLEAFEENIKLKGNSYTIFLDQNDERDEIIADIFMEKTDDEADENI